MEHGKFNIIIGGQAGSESKGKLSAWLADKYEPDLMVITASPNAGHTVVNQDGRKMVSYHLPIGATVCDCPIVLTPASLINADTLNKEILDLGIDPDRIIIDPRASLILPSHIKNEEGNNLSDIGSTLQGVGECRVSKMRRGKHTFIGDINTTDFMGCRIEEVLFPIQNCMLKNGIVLCETTQGFDLCLEHGIDRRYCTSKMISPAMAMAEAGVPPSLVGSVYGVVRPYPIRVNNRTGTSGPYTEAKEITWDEVAKRCGCGVLGPEITTTTKLPRRVFEFSWSRFLRFIIVCKPTSLCLQFANYIDWDIYGASDSTKISNRLWNFIWELTNKSNVPVDFVGTGPNHNHMIDMEARFPN